MHVGVGPMPANSAICLVVERLRASALGTYGNTWFETRGLDCLASEAATLDHAVIDSPHLNRLCRSYWQALHALRPDSAGASFPGLPELLSRQPFVTALITDQPEVADHALAAAFTECVRVALPQRTSPAQQVHQTELARLLAIASDWLERHAARHPDAPFLLWVHARGMAGPWDAPLAFRKRLVDADDPQPPTTIEPPCRLLPDDFDPDDVFGTACAYAGQVLVLDECVEALLAQLRRSPFGETTLLTLIGAHGFPLGEHRQIGPAVETLYGETVHVPWLIRLPRASAALFRTQDLVQPADLAATLADWLGVALVPRQIDGSSLLPVIAGDPRPTREWVLSMSAYGERAIRTPAWLLRRAPAEPPELFAKPDDRWEVNNVADRCQEVAAGLMDAMDRLEEILASNGLAQLPPLAPCLVAGL